MNKRILAEFKRLEKQAEEVLATKSFSNAGSDYVDTVKLRVFTTTLLSFIEKFYGSDHVYYTEVQSDHSTYYDNPSNAERRAGILASIREEFESGFFTLNLRSLIAEEIFSDYLEMAEHLLESGYKDASAVIIGSSLESHLRQLCVANEISLTDDKDKIKTAGRLNSDLYSNEVYSRLYLHQVTGWLEIRNNAAHGHYDEYDRDQVSQMLQGVTNFISSNQ